MKQEEFFNRYHYNIDRDYLGGGGFGKVYKAFDDTLDRTVAIKVAEVRRGQDNVSLLKEVELAESIPKHRNIAHYQSCHRFKTPQGTFDYGILQYYPQGNLSQLLEHKQLSDQQKEGIARGILEGLKHLHNHRIVHRDLKSSNILMARRPGGEYVPKIADFGLSKQFEEFDRSYFSNSFAGGSLLYVAPEQLTGDKIRKNADLWSLGVVLYELFVGEVPFYPRQSDIGTETGRAEIVRQINEASIPKEIEQVPDAWRKLIESCLVTDAQQRLGSVAEIQGILGDKHKAKEASERIKVQKSNSDETVIEEEQQTTSEQTVQTTENSNQKIHWYFIDEKLKYGLIDGRGEIIIPAKYDFAYNFKKGLAKVELNNNWGFINKRGEEITSIKYDDVWTFSEGRAAVELNSKWGYINKEGEVVIPIEYDWAIPFSEGRAIVKLNGKYGYINKEGVEVIPIKYDWAEAFSEGLAAVELNDKYGYINKEGEVIIPFTYDRASSFNESLAKVIEGSSRYYINREGNCVKDCK